MKSTASTSSKLSTRLFNIFFWSFNVSLLVVIHIGFLPFIGLAFMADTATGQIPFNLLVPFIGLVGVPTTCTIAAFTPKAHRASLSLFQIFYGIEAPLLLLSILRFFILRDLTPASSFLLITALVGTIVTIHYLAKGRDPNAQANLWHLVGVSLFLFSSLYIMAIASFFVIPTLQLTLSFGPGILMLTTMLLPLTILLLGITSASFGMFRLAWQGWKQNLIKAKLRYGRWNATALVSVIAVLWLGTFIALQNQPQNQAFALLKTPPQTERDRQVLLQKSEVIRQGLLNAYLSAYRYPRSAEESSVYQYYHDTLKQPKILAQAIQNAFDFVTHPFQYGGTPGDREKAEKLYAEFFDAPILRKEQSAIQKAVTSTFNRGEAKASLLDVNQKRVRLGQQEITIKPQGDWAEVELYEVYENQTQNPEEILYYFSLPESSVVTGLWLGEKSNRATSFPFQISTRGAAQKIYTQQVVRNVDPALLEQVGPRNYRLRAFPIPAQGDGKMHLWMTYKTLKQGKNWPMPTLNEKRNVYWSNGTQRKINGKAASAPEQWLQDQWLPDTVSANKIQPVAHQLTLPSGGTVLAKPFAPKDYSLPQNKRIAVVLDESYSMNAHRQEAEKTFQWLAGNILNKNQADLYLTASSPAQPKKLMGIKKFDVAKSTFYGLLEPRQMLQQFQALRRDASYDAVLLITDPGSYELTKNSKTVLSMPAPLWVLHLGGLQPAYDDATLEAIQSSGGSVSTDVQDIMRRIATQPSLGNGTSLLSVVDDYAWFLSQKPDASTKTEEAFAPIAARQWVTQVSQAIKPDQLKELDAVHVLAKRYNLVTPYSSMIVLVNDQQKQDLKKAEKDSDRFNRKVEDQQLPQPTGLGEVSAVPEPEEWLLMGVGTILLGAAYRHHRKQSAKGAG